MTLLRTGLGVGLERLTTASPLKGKLFIIAVIVGSGFLTFGIGLDFKAALSPDSVGYLQYARLIARDYYMVLNKPLISSPPGYPFLLGLLGKLMSVDPLEMALPLNSVFLVGFLAVTFMIQQGHFKRKSVSLLVTCLTAFSFPLVSTAGYLWTDLAFALMAMLVLHFGLKIWAGDSSRSVIMPLGACVVIATYIRYAGVFLIPFASLLLFLALKRQRIVRLLLAGAFTLTTSLPLIFLFVLNNSIAGTATGVRVVPSVSFTDNARDAADTMLNWFIPFGLATTRPLFIVLGILIGSFLTLLMIEKKKKATQRGISGWCGTPVILFLTLYLVFILAAATMSNMDPLRDRLLLPILVPALTAVGLWLQRYTELLDSLQHGKSLGMFIVIVTFVGFGIAQVPRTLDFSRALANGEIGFGAKKWRNSELILLLDRVWKGETLYTNQPWIIQAVLSREATLVPLKTHYRSQIQISSLEELRGVWPPEGSALLCWFEEGIRGLNVFQPEELKAVANLVELVSCQDGVLYKVQRH